MARKSPRMSRYEAEQLLGLSGTYDYKQCQKAIRAAIKANHPDLGGDAAIMVRVVAAKEAMAYYFGDDKSQVMTAATEDEAPQESFFDESWDDPDDTEYTDCEYAGKPQREWSAQDWEAFMSFKVPRSFKGDSGYQAARRRPDWDPVRIVYGEVETKGHAVDSSRVSVEGWGDEEWFFYWLVNTRFPRESYREDYPAWTFDTWDGRPLVWTSKSKPRCYINGPEAERDAARDRNWFGKSQSYQKSDGDWVRTPYGRVRITDANGVYTSNRSGWEYNVGVPFAYARVDDYERWLELNLEAQREAIGGRDIKPAASHWGWTGLEFLRPEDRDAPWIRELGLFVPEADCSGTFPQTPSSIGVWDFHPENPTLTRHVELELDDHKAAAKRKARIGSMNPIARFFYNHLTLSVWLVIIFAYLVSGFFTPYMMGYADGDALTEGMRHMDMGGFVSVFLCEYTLPIAAFVFRKKVRAVIESLCEKTGKA